MPSWQTRAVCLYVRATRKRRHRTSKRSLHTLAPGLPAAPPPRRLRDRLSVEQVTGFKVVCVQARAGGAAATPGTLVDFHGGAFISRIARQH